MQLRRNLVLGALAVAFCFGANAPAGAQTCFGQTPTIVGAAKIKGTKGNDVILGSAFAHDDIDGGGGSDVICGLDGDDNIKVKNGTATIDGGPGNDRISAKAGGNGSSNIQGGSGDDVISFSAGGGGSNTVDGGADNDTIKANSGGGGSNVVNGGSGDDEIKFNSGGGGGNTVDGGLGTDTCKAKGADPICEIVD